MEERTIILKGTSELVLPVTPESYQVESGVNVEVVNIHGVGDVNLFGYGTLATIKIHCMLPANPYPFATDHDPDPYIHQLERWTEQKRLLRFIVGGTGINIPVKIENLSYGEEDGTNDVYADLILREYRQLQAVQVSTAPEENKPRTEAETPAPSVQIYVIQAGDTLSGICRRFYGDSSASSYNKLAACNGIPNPHLIYAGNVLRIPQPLS